MKRKRIWRLRRFDPSSNDPNEYIHEDLHLSYYFGLSVIRLALDPFYKKYHIKVYKNDELVWEKQAGK